MGSFYQVVNDVIVGDGSIAVFRIAAWRFGAFGIGSRAGAYELVQFVVNIAAWVRVLMFPNEQDPGVVRVLEGNNNPIAAA